MKTIYTVKWVEKYSDGDTSSEREKMFELKEDAIEFINSNGGIDQGDGRFFVGDLAPTVGFYFDPKFPVTSQFMARISEAELF